MSARPVVPSRRLAGKVAIVTGGASGLGYASCERFAAAGAQVVCVDVDATRAADAAAALGGAVMGIHADVTDPAALESVAAQTLERHGRIDVLYANAGVSGEGAVDVLEIEEWRRVLSINLDGVYFSVRAVLPAMLRQGSGSLILQGSTAALSGLPNIPSYSAAKAGVVGLMRQLSAQYAPAGIRCNALCPGTIVTPLVLQAYVDRFGPEDADAALARRSADYPLGRLGIPEDVADYAVFLASDESSWVTGSSHAIDGGIVSAMESPR
jgi:NAD(P)-dependent dehydrogenase (short-subunit alcohol dehydrogenase family)